MTVTWRRSEAEAVLPRRAPVDPSTGIKAKALRTSEPPQGIEVLAARVGAHDLLVELVAVIGDDHGLHHTGPWDVPGLLDRLTRWRGYVDRSAVADALRHARRHLLRALDGLDTRPGIVACPDLECADAGVVLRSQHYALGVECPGCGRRWTGAEELAALRRLVEA